MRKMFCQKDRICVARDKDDEKDCSDSPRDCEKYGRLLQSKHMIKNEKKPTILITNDDGVMAHGIRHLWNALKDFANLYIVAPASEQSGVGMSVTIRKPIEINEISWDKNTSAYAVTGTPTDCIRLGLKFIFDQKPDLIVSGINRGANSGRNIFYSGTCGGIIEGVIKGIPGIAFSGCDFHNPSFDWIEPHICNFVEYIICHPLPKETFLNVNFPMKENAPFKGIKWTSQGKEYWAESPDIKKHPEEGHNLYWMGAKLLEFEEEDDCDVSWLKKGYATCVPIQIGNLTHKELLTKKRASFAKFFDRTKITTNQKADGQDALATLSKN